MLEHELNEIYRLLLDGVSPQEIKRSRNISDRNYTKYVQKLRDNIISDQLSKRQQYFLLDIDIARERLLADKRQLQSIITNPDASVKDKLDAINSDIALNITLMRLEYEGSLFVKNQLSGRHKQHILGKQ
jgi:chaperonin GroEL (HSP60 family)